MAQLQIRSSSLESAMGERVCLMLCVDLDGGMGRQGCFGSCTSEALGLSKCGNLEAKLMLTEGNTRSSYPGLVAVGCRRDFFSIEMTDGGHLSAVPGTIFNF